MTAVEWLFSQLWMGIDDPMDKSFFSPLLERAREMERKQSNVPELSDQEIREQSNIMLDKFHWLDQQSFFHGAKWYREQLKQSQSNKQQ